MNNQLQKWEPPSENLGADWFDDLKVSIVNKVILVSAGIGIIIWLMNRKRR
jgi:hypothetical protein